MRSFLLAMILGLGTVGLTLGSPSQVRADDYRGPAYNRGYTTLVGHHWGGRSHYFYPGFGYGNYGGYPYGGWGGLYGGYGLYGGGYGLYGGGYGLYGGYGSFYSPYGYGGYPRGYRYRGIGPYSGFYNRPGYYW